MNSPHFQAYTYSFSLLYFDETRRKVVHGSSRLNPKNIFLEFNGKDLQLFRKLHDVFEPICLSADGSLVAYDPNGAQEALKMQLLSVDFGLFGLKSGNLFLSAQPDGSLFLCRTHCLNWEHFRIYLSRPEDFTVPERRSTRTGPSSVYINRLLSRESPAISIVVPIFNQRKYLSELIDSVLGQTVKDLELIIIDDGSVDQGCDVVRRFADPRVRYVWQRNSGTSVALNRGIDLARGKYIGLLGGDDVCEPWRVETQLSQIEEQDCDLIFDLPSIINEDSETLPDSSMGIFFSGPFVDNADLFRRLFFYGNFLCAPSVFARSEFFTQVGRFKAGLLQLQDFDLWARACRMGARVALQNSRTVRYRVRDGLANLSLSPMNYKRSIFEHSYIMRSFFKDAPLELLQESFPGANFQIDHDGGLPISFDALLLYMGHVSAAARSVASEWILDSLDNEGIRGGLEDRGISITDVFRLTSSL